MAKFLDLENAIRHSPKAFGIRLGKVGRGAFEQAVRAAVAEDPLSAELMDAMLTARAALWKQYCRLHDLVVRIVARSEPCRRFMAIPGVGPVTALSFMTAIDDPSRFRRSRDVAAYFRHFLGKPDMARHLGGSEVGFEIPGLGVFYGPNLTPDEAMGLGRWSERDVVTAIRTGKRPDGRMLAPIMPWAAFAELTDSAPGRSRPITRACRR